jgi:hypothetical protein
VGSAAVLAGLSHSSRASFVAGLIAQIPVPPMVSRRGPNLGGACVRLGRSWFGARDGGGGVLPDGCRIGVGSDGVGRKPGSECRARDSDQKVRNGGLVQLTVRVKPAQKKRPGRNPATGEAITIAAKPASVDVRARPLARAKGALPSVQKARRRLAA